MITFYFVYSYTLLRFLTKYDNYIVCFKRKQQMNFLVSQYASLPGWKNLQCTLIFVFKLSTRNEICVR